MTGERMTTEELIYRVDGMAWCALNLAQISHGRKEPKGFLCLLEALCDATDQLAQRADTIQEKE